MWVATGQYGYSHKAVMSSMAVKHKSTQTALGLKYAGE